MPSPAATSAPTWIEHFDLVQIIIAILMAYLVFTMRELINWFKASIADLYAKHDVLSGQLNKLQGEHNASRHGHGRRGGDNDDGEEY